MEDEKMERNITGHRLQHNVLIIDDGEGNNRLFKAIFEAHGYTTFYTNEGRGAVTIARQRRPDLILMGVQVFETAGLEIMKRLKRDEELRNIPVVAIIGSVTKGNEEMIWQAVAKVKTSRRFPLSGSCG